MTTMCGDSRSGCSTGSRWLVAGGLGFIGSAFVRLVRRERPDVAVIVLDAMTYAGNPRNVADVADDEHFSFLRGDIADPSALDEAVGEGVDAIVNFAAETHVDRSILDARAFLTTGVLGVHALLEAVRRHGVGRFVQVSTDEVYGDLAQGSSSEDDPVRPRSPYAAAKASGDLLVQSYCSTFGTPAIVTRGSNTYGPYQFPEKLIPLFITNLLDGGSVPLYGNGLNVRDWLYVDDHARGVLCALERGVPGEIYNIGGGNERTNLEVTQRLAALTGREPETAVRYVRDREGHDRRYCVDATKLRRLGWAPATGFDDGLAATVAWYRERRDWWEPLRNADFRQYYARQYAHR